MAALTFHTIPTQVTQDQKLEICNYTFNDLLPIKKINKLAGWTDCEMVDNILETKYLHTTLNDVHILIAKVDNVARGYIVVSSKVSSDYIPYIAVDKDYKKRGLGKALLMKAIEKSSNSTINFDCRPLVKGFYDSSLTQAAQGGIIKKYSWEIRGTYMNGDTKYSCTILK